VTDETEYLNPVAPGNGRYEVWGERDNRLYRYCATPVRRMNTSRRWNGSTTTPAGRALRRIIGSVRTTATDAAPAAATPFLGACRATAPATTARSSEWRS